MFVDINITFPSFFRSSNVKNRNARYGKTERKIVIGYKVNMNGKHMDGRRGEYRHERGWAICGCHLRHPVRVVGTPLAASASR